jgi:hypothetical protein
VRSLTHRGALCVVCVFTRVKPLRRAAAWHPHNLPASRQETGKEFVLIVSETLTDLGTKRDASTSMGKRNVLFDLIDTYIRDAKVRNAHK